MRTYEGLFIFPGSFNEEELSKGIEQAKGEIEKLGGKVTGTDTLGRRLFARHLKKRTSGHYAKVRFDFDPTQIDALHKRYALSESVFRVQICRTEEPVAAEEAAA